MLPQEPDEDEPVDDIDDQKDEVDGAQIDEVIRNTSVHTLTGGGIPSYMQVRR